MFLIYRQLRDCPACAPPTRHGQRPIGQRPALPGVDREDVVGGGIDDTRGRLRAASE